MLVDYTLKLTLKNIESMLRIFYRKVLGVAEHPDIMETIEKELEIIAEYDDKLEMLDKYFFMQYVDDKEVING